MNIGCTSPMRLLQSIKGRFVLIAVREFLSRAPHLQPRHLTTMACIALWDDLRSIVEATIFVQDGIEEPEIISHLCSTVVFVLRRGTRFFSSMVKNKPKFVQGLLHHTTIFHLARHRIKDLLPFLPNSPTRNGSARHAECLGVCASGGGVERPCAA